MIGQSAGNERFDAVCVIGIGNHARTKLIPALIANGQRIVGVVSSRTELDLPRIEVFRHIEDSLASLPSETLFVLATPPRMHYWQAMAIIHAGRHVMVEKPAFELRSQAVDAFAAAARQQTLLIEAFMHRHTDIFRDAVRCWSDQAAAISTIDIRFTIPALPSGTFRGTRDPISSSLYDIGCYAISLISDLGLPLHHLTLSDLLVSHTGHEELMIVSGQAGDVGVNIQVGVDSVYSNILSYVTHDQRKFAYEPFFYGRPGERRRTFIEGGNVSVIEATEDDAFRKMFAVPPLAWRKTQHIRAQQVVAVTECLERLGAELMIARQSAR